MNNISYSIIIPHKNSAKLLERCIKSIPQRGDIQIIVVDDNSEEKEKIKLQTIIKNFRHTELHYTSANKGAGHARNIGLKHAQGKWILFADADDFFYENFITKIDEYNNSNFDIIYFNVDSRYSENLQVSPIRIREIPIGIKRKDIEYLKWKVHVVWGKLYSHKLIQDNCIYFDEVLASNDVMFACIANYHAKNCIIDDYKIYCSTINLKSLCYQMNEKNLDARYSVALRHNIFLHKIKKSRYQINLLSLITFYRKIGYKTFFKKVKLYSKDTSLKMKLIDFSLTLEGLSRMLLKPKNNLRKIQKIK